MALVVTDDKYYKEIAEWIRYESVNQGSHTFKPEDFVSALTTFRRDIEEMYETQAYESFWNSYQNYGSRTDYSGAFGGLGWNANNFKPLYSIKPTNAYHMFYCAAGNGKYPIDLSKFNLDFSKCTDVRYLFYGAHIVDTGFLDFSATTSLTHAFNGDGGSIKKIHLKVVKGTTFSSTFAYASDTEEVIFSDDSVISVTGLNLHWSTKLSKESIISLINALSSVVSEKKVTLSNTAVNNAFETAEGASDGAISQEWAELIATKSNWTISLV